MRSLILSVLAALSFAATAFAEPTLRASVFTADVTPPIGSPLCGGSVPPAQTIADPLSARGVE